MVKYYMPINKLFKKLTKFQYCCPESLKNKRRKWNEFYGGPDALEDRGIVVQRVEIINRETRAKITRQT